MARDDVPSSRRGQAQDPGRARVCSGRAQALCG